MNYDENETDTDKVKRIPGFTPDRSNWPNSIRTISLDDFEMMAVDAQGHLYWDGKRIELKRLTLSFWQKTAAGVIAVSAIIGATVPAWEWGCKLAWITICPS